MGINNELMGINNEKAVPIDITAKKITININ